MKHEWGLRPKEMGWQQRARYTTVRVVEVGKPGFVLCGVWDGLVITDKVLTTDHSVALIAALHTPKGRVTPNIAGCSLPSARGYGVRSITAITDLKMWSCEIRSGDESISRSHTLRSGVARSSGESHRVP
jgi:hypothetical protein